MLTFRPLAGGAGRLGNQLWEIASTAGIARTRGEDFILPHWDYAPYFNVPKEFFGKVPGSAVDSCATVQVNHIDDRAKVYLQDYNLWSHIADEVKEWFQPSDLAVDILSEWDDIFEAETLSVHIRRGDNVTHPVGIHPLRTMEYYMRAAAHHPEADAIIFSDDIPWCQQNLTKVIAGDLIFIDGNPSRPPDSDQRAYRKAAPMDWIDLQLMANCDHHIISNSTYAWWGAFLSDDPAPIYPSNWFGFQLDYIDASLMFPDNWVEVEDYPKGMKK